MRRRTVVDRQIRRFRAVLVRIDRQIVRDLGVRERAQHALLAYKKRNQVPLFDPPQEQLAGRRARSWARRRREDGRLAEKVIRSAISSGKSRFLRPTGAAPGKRSPSGRAASGSPRSRRRRTVHRST